MTTDALAHAARFDSEIRSRFLRNLIARLEASDLAVQVVRVSDSPWEAILAACWGSTFGSRVHSGHQRVIVVDVEVAGRIGGIRVVQKRFAHQVGPEHERVQSAERDGFEPVLGAEDDLADLQMLLEPVLAGLAGDTNRDRWRQR